MSDNHIDEAKSRVKDVAGSSTRDQIAKNDSQADKARTTVKDKATTSSTPSQAAAPNSTHAHPSQPGRRPRTATCSQSCSSSS